MEKKAIGSYIAELRKSSGMTQQQLADRLNVSNKTVSKWERGDSYPEITLIPEIADVFGVTSDEILRSRVITEIGAEETKAPETHEAVNISIDDRQSVSMVKYRVGSVVSMGIAALGVILMLIISFAMQQKEIGFGVCILFAAVAFLAEAVNIVRTRSVLTALAKEGPAPSADVYETFFRPIPYVLCAAAAAVLLALPVIIPFEIEFPNGTVMSDFVYYLQSARYAALLSIVLLMTAIFAADRILGLTSRYGDINIFPRSKVKPILWLIAVFFIILI